MNKVLIRQATKSDSAGIRMLWRSFWPEMPYETNLESKIKKDARLVLVAESNKNIVGTIIGGFDGWWAWIYRLAVGKAYQQQGIGTRLFREMEKRIRRRGSTNICAIVSANNQGVNRLLGNFGMSPKEQIFVGKRFKRKARLA